jgi:hypothetical protein
MKRLFGLVLVLCVVAPATYGTIYLDEYTWQNNTGGNFADAAQWLVTNTNDPLGKTAVQAAHPLPYASINAAPYTNYARPTITASSGNGPAVTINTDTTLDSSGNAVGYQQMQILKGTVTVDAGGKLQIGSGYLQCSGNTVGGGLVVQNGGQYKCTATVGTQQGTLMTYTTANSKGSITVQGSGSLFDSVVLFGGRAGQTQVRSGTFIDNGTGQTINVGTMGPGGTNVTMTYKFITDTTGVAPINVSTLLAFQNNYNATATTGNKSILDFVLTAAPTEGQVFTLFNLADTATRTGLLQTAWGTNIIDNGRVQYMFGSDVYTFATSYTTNGNDITLTTVPEPATLGLLSLGGLVLARRRRA